MNESDLLTRAKCEEVFGLAQSAAQSRGVKDVEVLLLAGAEALTRFANNAIHQNVSEESRHVSVRVLVDQRTARATTNRLDRASIDLAVGRAIDIARALEPDPELLPLAEPEAIEPVDRFDPATANCPPETRARAVAEAIRLVESDGQNAAGIYSTEQGLEAIMNSRGLSAYYAETMAKFSITAMKDDSSGWAKASAIDIAAFDPIALARRAARKAALSKNPRNIDPGRYTVILEPAAVLDLVGQIFMDFAGTALEDQRSFLTERLETQLFGANITIDDDTRHPLQAGMPFDSEGVPRQRLRLVDQGVPRELAYSRLAAKRADKKPTGHGFPPPTDMGEAPMNIVIHGGSTSVEDMIASTERGILVTRLWYIREVDPYEKIMTGMTRDGTFLVEDGKIVCGVRNFRFNQSVIELLNNVESMSAPERSSGEESFDMVVPAMRVNGFNFTEVTTF